LKLNFLKPFATVIARRPVARRDVCGREKLLKAFDHYSGNGDGLCTGCRYTTFEAVGDWLGPDVSCPYGAKMPGQ